MTEKDPDKKIYLLWGLLSLLIWILFIQIMLHNTGGHLCPPNTDFYIFFQYGRQLFAGHPFQLNTGDPGTSAATSLLYTVVIGFGSIFFKGMWLYGYALGLALLLLIGTAFLFYRIANRFFGRQAAIFSTALMLLNGPLIFNYFGGTDSALFGFLFWALLYIFCFPLRGRRPLLALLSTLLIYTRPEGIVLFLLIFGIEIYRSSRENGTRENLWVLFIPGAAIISLYLLNYIITGSYISTSMRGRSLFGPFSLLSALKHSVNLILNSIKGILGGFMLVGNRVGLSSRGLEGSYFAPFMFFFSLIGFADTLKEKADPTEKWLAIIIIISAIITLATSSLTLFSGVSHHRHIVWTYPGIILLAVVGLNCFSRLFVQAGPKIELGFLGLWIIMAGFSLYLHLYSFGKVTHHNYFQNSLISEWINQNIPSSAKIMVFGSASSYKYMTGRYIIDAGGTGFKELNGATFLDHRSRLLEYLQHSNNLPEYLLIRPNQNPLIKELVKTGTLLHKTNSFLPDEISLYKLDLTGIMGGLTPQSPAIIKEISILSLKDEIDIGYPASEQNHRYSTWLSMPETLFARPVVKAKIDEQEIWDAGQVILGEESFEIKASPGKDLLWVTRIKHSFETKVVKDIIPGECAFKADPITMDMKVNDQSVVKLVFKEDKSDHWKEISYLIPGKYITDSRIKISITGNYGSFHHWFYQ